MRVQNERLWAAVFAALLLGSSCGAAAASSKSLPSDAELPGCYYGESPIPLGFDLYVDLNSDGSYALAVVADIGAIDTAHGRWSRAGNRLQLLPDHPDQRPLGLNGPLLITRTSGKPMLHYRDTRGNRTVRNWDRLKRVDSCEWLGRSQDGI